MNTTQHRLAIILCVLMAVLTAGAQSNSSARHLQKGIETFLASDGLMKSTIHDGQGIYQHVFKIPYGEKCVTNAKGMPRIMERLERAFTSTQAAASSSFVYNIDEKVTPIKVIQFIWNNSYRNNTVFHYYLANNLNCRFSTYTDKDGTRHFYGLVWNFAEFTDKDDKPYKSIDGYILELHGKHWSYLNMTDDYYKSGARETTQDGLNGNTAPDTLDFVKLREKINSVSKMYAKAKAVNDEETQDALVYVMYKLSREYKGTFDAAQFKTLKDMLQNMSNDTVNNSRNRLMSETLATFSKAIEDIEQPQSVQIIKESSNIYRDIMLSEEQSWELFKRYEWSKAKLGSLYECKIEGNTTLPDEYVVIKPMIYDNTRYRYRTHDGSFAFNGRVPMGQFVSISEGYKNTWWVITDSVPLTIDMEDGNVEGSDLNKRFLQYQRRIKRMAGELRKYMSNNYILAQTGYNAIMDSIRMIGQEAVKENQDNVIPAFFLAEDYHNIPYEQLEKVMDRNKAYANHIVMQPVWQYFDGVKKRLPGRKYIDLELQDTAGVKHNLSEYVGKGNYVLLHFWSTKAWWSRRELKYVKDIVRENKDKPLTVIGISMNQDEEDWKEYVKARGLNWTHLSSPDKWDGDAATAYGVTALPTSVLIAPDGTIVAQDLRNAALQEKVKKLNGFYK
ncbi:MAG: TlpA family protein disulfide reductase [Prevotella sp.]|nr:TlpA family protein disulfide reductase [Prevotella sp.]